MLCRVLGSFYRWSAARVSDGDWADAHVINATMDVHHDDPEFAYRIIADELSARGITAGRNRVNRLCTQQRLLSVHAKKRGPGRKPGPPVRDDLVQRESPPRIGGG